MNSTVLAKGFLLVALVGGTVACSADDAANKALKDAGVNVNTQGGLPNGFPSAVPAPDLKIETGIGVGTGFTLRLTSPNAVSDVAAYKAKLTAAGFTVSNEFDNTAGAGHNVGFDATGKGFRVVVVAFPQDTPVDGGYMGMQVDPAG